MNYSEKKLNFYHPLPEKVLSGKKNTTWRINDDKNLSCGDIVICTNNEQKDTNLYPGIGIFAKVKIIWTKETTFGELTKEDLEGHEEYTSQEEMYKTYSGYYNIKVNDDTRVKVIKFRLIEKIKI